MDELERAVNECFEGVLGESIAVMADGVDVKLNETGWAMFRHGWFAPARRPDHERIEA